MMRILFKTLLRTTVLGSAFTALALGGAALLVGPDRVGAMVGQWSDFATAKIDENLDDPAVLKRRLDHVASKYPEQIKVVREDLAELRQEMERLKREQLISERVVTLIDEDLERLTPAVAQAEASGMNRATSRLALVAVNGDLLSERRLKGRLSDIRRERSARAQTAVDAAHNYEILASREKHFAETLEKLEVEEAELRSKIVQLTNEIENVARTERLIEMLEEREATLRSVERFEIESLDGLRSALDRRRLEQEARLDQLSAEESVTSYETIARETLSSTTH